MSSDIQRVIIEEKLLMVPIMGLILIRVRFGSTV